MNRAICRNIHPCSSGFLHKVLTSIRNFLIVAIMETLRLALVICVWHDEFKREFLCGNESRQDWLHSIPNVHFLIGHCAMSIRIESWALVLAYSGNQEVTSGATEQYVVSEIGASLHEC